MDGNSNRSPRDVNRRSSKAVVAEGDARDAASPGPMPMGILNELIYIASLLFQGVVDALAIRRACKVIIKSKTVQRAFLNCLILNGGLFLTSHLLFEYLIGPRIRSIFAPHQQILILTYLPNFFSLLYYMLWIYPVYAFSFIFNAVWYGELAEAAYRKLGGKGDTSGVSLRGIVQGISDELYRNLLFLTTVVFARLLYTLPFAGLILQFSMITWLSSFFIFDYKWLLQGGVSLKRRLRFFEAHWAYMYGFGLPFTAASFFFPYLVSYGIYALLYPLFIVLAVAARPARNQDTAHLPKSIPLFDPARRFNNLVVRGLTWLRTWSLRWFQD